MDRRSIPSSQAWTEKSAAIKGKVSTGQQGGCAIAWSKGRSPTKKDGKWSAYILGVIEVYDDVSSYGKGENPCLHWSIQETDPVSY
jgi:hypothetical protein